ncbi:MAG: site-specific DNA-methyltransferase [Clostridiales bacterium]|nr:site-specific DNA-methyltransferase [Clostridiales bacterium]
MIALDKYPIGEYHYANNGTSESLDGPWGTFYWADVLDGLISMVERYEGKIQLVYMDPPFMTGCLYRFRQKIGEKGLLEHIAYSDKWGAGNKHYLDFMKKVFEHVYNLLTPDGSFYLHVDYRTCAYLKIILDKIFGEKNFLNEIIWHYQSGGRAKRHFSRKHDNILFYRKSPKHYFNIEAVGKERGTKKRNHMKMQVDNNGKVSWTIKSGGRVYRYYQDSKIYPSDVWTDISHLHQRDPERLGYDTQKPEALLERIILSSSRPGDLVADFFVGSGTTLSVATKLGRKWVGMDSSPHAMHVCRKRLLGLDVNKDFAIYYKVISRSTSESELVAERQENQHSENRDNLKGVDTITITNYKPAKKTQISVLENPDLDIKGLEYIDYWAVGYIKGDLFYPVEYVWRRDGESAIKNTVALNCSTNQDLVVHLVDILGDQHFYKCTQLL